MKILNFGTLAVESFFLLVSVGQSSLRERNAPTHGTYKFLSSCFAQIGCMSLRSTWSGQCVTLTHTPHFSVRDNTCCSSVAAYLTPATRKQCHLAKPSLTVYTGTVQVLIYEHFGIFLEDILLILMFPCSQEFTIF